MNDRYQIWREHRLLLFILGVLLIANTIFFFTYRVRYEQRLTALDERLARSESDLAAARSVRVTTEKQLASYKQIQADVQEIYNRRWATREERLTAMIAEVKRLAVASNLVPKSYTFTQTAAGASQNPGGSTAGPMAQSLNASEVGISFHVAGNYQQVRRLINLLELSDQFVIVQQIALSATADKDLTVSLFVKTLFRDTAPPRRPVSRAL